MAIYYVSTTGNDSYNGLYATYTTGSNGPKATIASAISASNGGDTITIADGTYNQHAITISKNLIINGTSQNTIINATNTSQIFIINSGITATISNFTLKNGYIAGSGGAVYNSGTLTVNNINFLNNSCGGSFNGGAVCNKLNAILTVTNCIFTGNSAIDNYGGAIYNSSTLNITTSTFTDNSAIKSGGAICSDGGIIHITGSDFNGNTSTCVDPDGGGAIQINGGSLTLTTCTFENNSATNMGGAINIIGTGASNCALSLNITECTFTNNTAGDSGAIYFKSTEMTIDSSTFTGNSATGDYTDPSGNGSNRGFGGAIHGWNCILHITNTTFDGNNATTAAGALFNDGGSTTDIDNCIFENNYTTTNTGGVYGASGGAITNNWQQSTSPIGTLTVYNTILNITNTIFDNNLVQTVPASPTNFGGGAIRMYGGEVHISFCTFENNTAPAGGAILRRPSSSTNIFTLHNNNYRNNSPDILFPTEDSPATITCNPPSGVYTDQLSVQLLSDTIGTIYYTTDGSIPDGSSSIYISYIWIGMNRSTLKFFMMDELGYSTDVFSEAYMINVESSAQTDSEQELSKSLSVVSINPGSWLVEGNIVTDELDGLNSYSSYHSNMISIPALDESPEPTIGDTFIKITTPGEITGEGIQEQPATVDTDIGDSVWHSLYVHGSGTVILQIFERDKLGQIISNTNSSPLVLTDTDQKIDVNHIITTGVLISFKLVTNSTHAGDIYINGIYVNKGDIPRTGQNLVIDNIAFTGQDGSTDGFAPQPTSDSVISVLPISDKLEMQYQSGGT